MTKMEWQPIETAPKDGSDIILYFPLRELSTDWQRIVMAYYVKGEWVFSGRACRGYSSEYQPSHWMPLPNPPEAPHE